MFRLFKKTIGVCFVGIGIGVLLVLLLPITGWLFLFGVVMALVGILWVLCE